MLVDFSKLFDSIHREMMEQILYGLPKEAVTAIMMLYKNTKAIVRSIVDIDTGAFQNNTLAIFL